MLIYEDCASRYFKQGHTTPSQESLHSPAIRRIQRLGTTPRTPCSETAVLCAYLLQCLKRPAIAF